MAYLSDHLDLVRCPHCAVSHPNLWRQTDLRTRDFSGRERSWGVYQCGRCGSLVTAWAHFRDGPIEEHFPQARSINDDIPERAKAYLTQAYDSLHAPAGAVMLAASAVDAMLKVRGYTEGSLHARIEKAVADNVLTKEMASWAHAVRLDANNQRHADEAATLPNAEDAKRVLEFASALGEFLFVLPARIAKGIRGEQA